MDWSAIEHAHGPATDVPTLLRAAVSDDPEPPANPAAPAAGNRPALWAAFTLSGLGR